MNTMRHLVPAICILLGGCLSRPGHFNDENTESGSSSSFEESESGDEDESESGDDDYDVGDGPKFDVLFVPDAPEEPDLPQCSVVATCDDELNMQANCPAGTHCVRDPDPGHCEPNQDNCVCGHVQCEDDQLCTWSDDLSWYLCD
jgi:hypothetical protein